MKKLLIILFLVFLYSCEEKIDEAHVSVNQPGPAPAPNEIKAKVNEINKIYVFEGSYEYVGEEVTLEKVEELLRELDENKPFNIYVSEKANQSRLVNLLNIMNKLDFSNFNIHTTREKN